MKKSSYTVLESSLGMVTYNEKEGPQIHIYVTRPQPHTYPPKLNGIISIEDAKALRNELDEVLEALKDTSVEKA